MIKELSDALKSLINSLSIRPVATILALLIIGTAYVTYRSYDEIQSHLIVTPDEEAKRFKSQLDSYALVNDSIDNLKVALDGHDVVIKQFHNGKHDLTGIPFTASTPTFFTKDYDLLGDEPISAMNASLRLMWRRIDKPECIILYKPVDVSSSRYFKEYDLARAAICPLTNPLNYPIGTITIGLKADDQTTDEKVLDSTREVASRITGYLDDGNI